MQTEPERTSDQPSQPADAEAPSKGANTATASTTTTTAEREAMARNVFTFANGTSDGPAGARELLGGKGANLAEMTNLGIPVPPGFTITTEVCAHYSQVTEQEGFETDARFVDGLWDEVAKAMNVVESATGRKFGDADKPLLVSVRSGAAVSMPGMMDTVLNLGLNAETVRGLAAETGNARFAWDSYRRFVQMYGNVVQGIDASRFEHLLEKQMEVAGVERDSDLSATDLQKLVPKYLALSHEVTGEDFPQMPMRQLRGAIEAVFKSWNNDRAKVYRQLNKITGLHGTAVNVQAMVFGNTGENSGTGVCFTRDPSTGEKVFYGEYLTNAQGEDVVAGVRTPQPLSTMGEALPEASKALEDVMTNLEKHYREMQDMEFTVQDGTLYMLQTRTGKRTAKAALKIACDMVDEGLITPQEAIQRVDATQLENLLHPSFDPDAPKELLATGIAASPGSAAGAAALTPDKAVEFAEAGRKAILVRLETSPEDLSGMAKSQGFLTARGGKTSHAAVVARQMGKVCVSGCSDLTIDEAAGTFTVGKRTYREGELISIDGTVGEVYEGDVPTIDPQLPAEFKRIMGWADEFRRMRVRVNADTPVDCTKARKFGAEGIGLCRTEHMFFEEDRILSVRKMIMANDETERRAALAELAPAQRGDFIGIFRAMDGLPVNIRLLDPPLHEFLPHEADAQADVAAAIGVDVKTLRRRMEGLHEANPMLGHRGCRLGISFPEIYEMQVRAIIEAACEAQRDGRTVLPEIMIPLVAEANELRFLRERLDKVCKAVIAEEGVEVDYKIGTMIEIPRAALTADEVAKHAEFFSFGTNDLTQMAYGFSRDDAGSFLPHYFDTGMLPLDPFEVIDRSGVGKLMEIATEAGRKTKPGLKVGICGETGGESNSINFCEEIGLDYVSCSPYRIPGARLAAAQATLARQS